MNHKDRVLTTIKMEEPDRVPLATDFHETQLKRLNTHFNTRNLHEIYDKLGLDCISASVADGMQDNTLREGYIPRRFPDGSYINEWGVKCIRPINTDITFLEHPIKKAEDLDEFKFPDPRTQDRTEPVEEIIDKFGEEYAVVGTVDYGLFEKAWILRGFNEFIVDLNQRPDFANKLLDSLFEFDKKIISALCKLDIEIFFGSDDYGMQNRLMISPSIFRRFFKDRWRQLLAIPRNKGIPVMFHSDGQIKEIIPDLIEIGVEILNPVMPRCMDPAEIKEEYGKELAQYGTIDIQWTLPFGKPEDVENEVVKRIETVGPGGGLVMAPTHTLLPDVPLQNYLTFIRAVKRFGRYPLKKT